ncbi:hypothetical protein ES703_48393 [subsurface metagenome]|nr:hypothetical protein [bacterium]
MFLLVLVLYSVEWVETTQEDFCDGWIDVLSCHVSSGSKIFGGGPLGFSDSCCGSYYR